MNKDKLLKKIAKPLEKYMKDSVDTPVCVISFVDDKTLEIENYSFDGNKFTNE